MKYVGKLFGQIGRTRGYFDTGKTSGDWDALEARAERAEAEVNELKESILVQRIFSDYRQRAESAEAIVGKLQELHGCSQEMVVHWCEHAANRSLGLDQARSELAAERARLDWLAASDTWFDYPATESFNPETFRDAIDAAMKERAI